MNHYSVAFEIAYRHEQLQQAAMRHRANSSTRHDRRWWFTPSTHHLAADERTACPVDAAGACCGNGLVAVNRRCRSVTAEWAPYIALGSIAPATVTGPQPIRDVHVRNMTGQTPQRSCRTVRAESLPIVTRPRTSDTRSRLAKSTAGRQTRQHRREVERHHRVVVQ